MSQYSGLITPFFIYDDAIWENKTLINYEGQNKLGDFTIFPTSVKGIRNHLTRYQHDIDIKAGLITPTYGSKCIFNRILASKCIINAGQLINNLTEEIEIWNTHSYGLDILSVDEAGFEGLNLTLADNYIGGGNSIKALLTLYVNGPPDIDATAIFNFSVDNMVLSILGSRIMVFSFTPDWVNGVTKIKEYKTNILTAYDGTEQRICLRNIPRKQIVYKYQIIDADEAAYFSAVIFGWQSRIFCVPDWVSAMQMTFNLFEGELILPIGLLQLPKFSGELIMLIQDYETYEILRIESKTDTSIKLAKPIANKWAAFKTILVPLYKMRMEKDLELNNPNANMVNAKITFSEV
ncbi:MAG: hypothetical protein ACI3ZR_05895 [bacterium]